MSRRRPQQRKDGAENANRNGRNARNVKAKQQRGAAAPLQPAEFWRAAPPVDVVERIEPAADPTALIRSLGSPPLTGQGTVADHYVAAVVSRAANLATALAAATGLLADDEHS